MRPQFGFSRRASRVRLSTHPVKKPFGKLRFIVAIMLFGMIASIWFARDPGPRVEGRSVREWMLSQNDGDDEKRAVLHSLGASAVPPLLAMMDERPGLDERGLEMFRRAQPLFQPRVVSAGAVNFAGARGLVLLGDPATNALVGLRERFDRASVDDRRRFHYAHALARLGPEGIAFLESRIEDEPEPQLTRLVACFDFNKYEPQAGFELALRLARQLGPERRRAVWLAMYQIEEPRWSEYRGRFLALMESGSPEDRAIASDALRNL